MNRRSWLVLTGLAVTGVGIGLYGLYSRMDDPRRFSDLPADAHLRLGRANGFTSEDLSRISALTGVAVAEGIATQYNIDATNATGRNSRQAIMITAIRDARLRDREVRAGRYPNRSGEVLVDEATVASANWQIGDALVLRRPGTPDRQAHIVGVTARPSDREVGQSDALIVAPLEDVIAFSKSAVADEVLVVLKTPADAQDFVEAVIDLLGDLAVTWDYSTRGLLA